MEIPLEDNLYQAIIQDDQDAVSTLLSQDTEFTSLGIRATPNHRIGANPNKILSNGKTSLGEAAYRGNMSIVKLLIDASETNCCLNKTSHGGARKRPKSYKRKLKHDSEHENVKCKNPGERLFKDYYVESASSSPEDMKLDKNQGYFVFIHSEGSSSDESRIPSVKSPVSPVSLSPPQAELEWDEDIGSFAPTTSEDETWASMYKWYAAILECTGAAIASAAVVTNGIDQHDKRKKTALHYAADQGHSAVVKLLLNAGCKVDVCGGDECRLTALHWAVIRNHIDIVKILIAAGSNVNYETHENMTPLHFAALRGFIDMVKILVNYGANLEARDENERTALYLAVHREYTDVVEYLISAGANVNCEEIHGYTPLCEAVWRRCPPMVEKLLKFGARITHSHKLLHNAVLQKQEDIVTMLASHGGAINIHNDDGDAPLLLAVRLSLPTIIRILLEKGANVNCCNSITGANALHIAVESVSNADEFEEILICLLEYWIDLNATALTGDTALNRALLHFKDEAAVLLIRHGADVNARDLRSGRLDNMSIASRRLTINLASMLRKAGHHVVAPEVIPRPLFADYWLYYASKQPLTLSDLCRIKIRHNGRNRILFRYIESLPVPKSLKRYLMMEDEGLHYCGSVPLFT